MNRWAILLIALAASLSLSALVWWLTGSPFGFLFLFAPFTFLGRRNAPPRPVCPACGHLGAPGDAYCPRDGTPLNA